MADKLSLPNLLSLLDVNWKDNADSIKQLCTEAEALRRRHQFEKAVEVAKYAVRLAYDAHDHILYGTALLYLSLARLSRNHPDEMKQAIRDCERAMTAFGFEPHNHAIAQIFRAQIDLHMENQADQIKAKEKWHHAAFVHFRRSAEKLHQLVDHWRARGNSRKVQYYEDLNNAVARTISELSNALVHVDLAPATPKQRCNPKTKADAQPLVSAPVAAREPTRSSRGLPPSGLPIPTELVWPVPDPIGLEVVSMGNPLATVDQVVNGFKPNASAFDYIEASTLSIGGRQYAIHPVNSAFSAKTSLKLRCGEKYIPFKVVGGREKTGHDDMYVLVRCRAHPDQAGDIVVMMDRDKGRVWIPKDGSESGPYSDSDIKIIGGVSNTGVRNQGNRQWNVYSATDGDKQPRIIGIVEATLTPIEPDHA